MLKTVRWILWLAVAIAALGGVYVAMRKPAAPIVSQTGEAAIGGPFRLTGGDGKPFDSSRLAGKPYAIFFGFTHCPDVCPTTLARLVKLRRQLGKGDDAFAIVFVSVDPERDGPAEVGAYATQFGTPIVGLTGDANAIDAVKKSFGVYSEKMATGNGDYVVNHTATVFLMDRSGRFQATIAPDESDAPAAEKLKRLTA